MRDITHPQLRPAARPLRVGFVPLCDCAPLLMARELSLFEKYGVEVELSREIGWATIRDKVIYGELDAAQAVAGLLYSCRFGLGSIRTDCVTGLILNLHGNAITLSRELRGLGVRDAETLRSEIERLRESRKFRFGVAFPFSSHNFVLCQWLREAGIDPARDVEIVSVPPPQMFPNLLAGHLDGYCVGEPWNSMAVLRGIGWCAATSATLSPRHPEKVLMVRSDFAMRREPEHLALIAALLEACAFCDRPENRERIMEALALPAYVDAPIQALRMSMGGSFVFGHGRVERMPEFHVFSRDNANEPNRDKGEWVLRQMLACGAIADPGMIEPGCVAEVFRPDIFRKAKNLIKTVNGPN